MKTIILSDTHLTDKFEPRKFAYLKGIILSADRVIVNGDFWDSFLVNFDKFINSQWQELFPLLLSRKAVYIYGNHDKKNTADRRVSLFSIDQVDFFRFNLGRLILHIEHGQKVAPAGDEKIPEIMKNSTIVTPYIFIREQIPLYLFGKNSLRQYKYQNKKMKKWANKNLTKNEILVCGHSHLSEFNLASQYINTGFIRHGFGQYLKIEGEKLDLVDEKY